MRLSIVDKVLLVLIVLELVVATNNVAVADDTPGCNAECRERRYVKNRGAGGSFNCMMHKYRDCTMCGAGQCSHNAVEDTLTDGTCQQQTTIQGYWPTTSCNEICNFPAGGGQASREAAEGPATYQNIEGWLLFEFKVKKCFKEGQPYKAWADEKTVMDPE